jgi:hypothetical protein
MLTGLSYIFYFGILMPIAVAMFVAPLWLIIRPPSNAKKRKRAITIVSGVYVLVFGANAIETANRHHLNALTYFFESLGPIALFYGVIWFVAAYLRWARDNPDAALRVAGLMSIAYFAVHTMNKTNGGSGQPAYRRRGFKMHGDE